MKVIVKENDNLRTKRYNKQVYVVAYKRKRFLVKKGRKKYYVYKRYKTHQYGRFQKRTRDTKHVKYSMKVTLRAWYRGIDRGLFTGESHLFMKYSHSNISAMLEQAKAQAMKYAIQDMYEESTYDDMLEKKDYKKLEDMAFKITKIRIIRWFFK
jgi:hypothetical protein